MSQKCLHQRIVNTTIVKFFTIVLQYNSNFRIILQHNSKKNIYIFYSLLCLALQFPSLSLFSVSPSALSSLQTQTPPNINININITHHPPLLKLNRFTLTLSIAEASHGVSSQTHLQIPLPIHPHPLQLPSLLPKLHTASHLRPISKSLYRFNLTMTRLINPTLQIVPI